MPLTPSRAASGFQFAVSLALTFQACYVTAIAQHVTLWDWPCPLSTLPWGFAQIPGHIGKFVPFYCGAAVVHSVAVPQPGGLFT